MVEEQHEEEQVIVTHIHRSVGGSIEVTVERAASTKGVTGIKVKVTGDDAREIIDKLNTSLAVAITAANKHLPEQEAK